MKTEFRDGRGKEKEGGKGRLTQRAIKKGNVTGEEERTHQKGITEQGRVGGGGGGRTNTHDTKRRERDVREELTE